jgi:hypothetical protein
VLVGGADEGFNFAQDALPQIAGIEVAVLRDQTPEARVAEQVSLVCHRLRNAVGVEREDVPLVQRDRRFLEQLGELLVRAGDAQADDQAVRDQHLRVLLAVGAQVHERRVSGARERHHARVQVDHRVGHRDEAARVEIVRDDPVDLEQQLPRRLVNLAEREHQPLQFGHVERGRRALARHVRDEDAKAAVPDVEEVVVVATNLARRHAERCDRDARKIERTSRQQRHLDLPGDAKLFLQPLLLRCRLQQILDAARHLVERAGEFAELILRLDVDPVGEVPLPHALRAHEQLVHRARDRARERESHDERNRLDDEEHDADHEQHDEQRIRQAHAPHQERLRARQMPVQVAQPVAERHRVLARRAGLPVPDIELGQAAFEQNGPSALTGIGAGRRGARRIGPRIEHVLEPHPR